MSALIALLVTLILTVAHIEQRVWASHMSVVVRALPLHGSISLRISEPAMNKVITVSFSNTGSLKPNARIPNS